MIVLSIQYYITYIVRYYFCIIKLLYCIILAGTTNKVSKDTNINNETKYKAVILNLYYISTYILPT